METLFGFHAVLAVLKTDPKRIKQIYSVSGRKDERIKVLLELAHRQQITVKPMSRSELDKLLGTKAIHQGVAAECRVGSGFSEALLPQLLQTKPRTLLVLDEVQDPHNLGACLRSANAFGVQAVIAPKDHAVGLTPAVRKVASGAAAMTPFIQVTNLVRTMKWLQEQGIWIVGLGDSEATPLSDIDFSGDIALVMGNEGRGIRKLTRKHCDYLAKIPVRGEIESLNVSAATAISLYEVTRQRLLTSCAIE